VTYPEAISFLYDLQMFGSKLGLENPRRLAALAGNPQDRLKFIHVAGTNGKGSTCAMLESIYRAAGLRVGLFTSPHLVAFGERIQINRRWIGEEDVARLAAELRELTATFPPHSHPTFFEVVTVMALRYFAEQQCDLVIWETGLGGRLDATNIVSPIATVITNIQYDHQQWLGDTLEKIAAEKAGIIKPGVPLITAVDDPAAFRAIYSAAREKAAPFWLITHAQAENLRLPPFEFPLAGEHQKLNAAVAAWTARAVAPVIPITDESIRAGLAGVEWPGRLQMVTRPGGQRVLLDGAHNVGSAEVLRASLPGLAGNLPVTLVIGMMGDKDWQPICRLLAPLAVRILVAPVASRRSAAPPDLAAACRKANPSASVIACDSLAAALAASQRDPFTLVTGSLYLVGEAIELLELSPVAVSGERALNNWQAAHVRTQDYNVAH
jgi:dihydrofolate synthase/folylpolyglutamate synthase